LHIACHNGHKSVLSLLLERGASVNMSMSGGSTLLFVPSEKGHQSTVRILLDHGALVDKANSNIQTSLYVAQTKGLAEIAKLLVSKLCEMQIKKIKTVINDDCSICLEKLT